MQTSLQHKHSRRQISLLPEYHEYQGYHKYWLQIDADLNNTNSGLAFVGYDHPGEVLIVVLAYI